MRHHSPHAHRSHGRGRPHRFEEGTASPPDFRPHHGRRERLFEPGHIRLLALHLLDQQPRHGYEIIRAIADLVGGDYSPSPGTVYPTLALLEDTGLATAATLENGRKQYAITDEGRAALDEQREHAERLVARLEHGRHRARTRGVPDIRRAMENLKTALRIRFGDELPDEDTIRRIAELIDKTAVDIGRA